MYTDRQPLPPCDSFWGKSSPRWGFHTESPGPFCTMLFHPELCAARWRHSLHSGEGPAHFHTFKGVNEYPVCHMAEGVTNQWSNARVLEFWSGRFGHKRHFQSLYNNNYFPYFEVVLWQKQNKNTGYYFYAVHTLQFIAQVQKSNNILFILNPSLFVVLE